ncbi:MAG: NAD(P)/FAD-dependent oxidoreductase [Deltaproteobacteria bacterium]|nr:NAD(P)/FAD-dependent oxidoreductase [Deltaproteobacteria bacterium]
MEKRVVIVGAGIAGLSTGCYARMNGFKTTIYEMHRVPGGLCAAWKRKGYTFDISMHMLTGSKGGPIYRMWQELGVTKDQKFVYHDEAARIESGEKALSLCADPRRLEQQMLALSPADAKLIKKFVRLITGRHMMNAMSLKPAEAMGFFDILRTTAAITPHIPTILKYGKTTLQEFAARFEDPFLRDAVRFIADSPGWPMLRFPMVALAGFIKSSMSEAGVPLGGSQRVVFRMAESYQKLGGEIRYKSRVKDVIVENHRAVGVRLDDGTEDRADIVVWAGDGHTVIFDILAGKYLDDTVRRVYADWTPVAPLVQVMLGIAKDLSTQPHVTLFEVEKPIVIAGEKRRWIGFRHHCFDPTLAPPGKSVGEVWYETRYDYWEELAQDRALYEEEKQRIAELTIAELDKRWPGLASQIEVVDVPTPITYVRYTGNWKGSPDGWYITPENMMKMKALRSLPGLSAFYMVGQWTAPFTGTVLAALTGRQLIELLCKQNGQPFVTSN